MTSRVAPIVAEPGRNGVATTAERFGWTIDGADYFRALRQSFERARHEIIIVGWDIDSRVRLVRDRSSPHYPSPLCDTLQSLVARRSDLCVYVLSWDFSMIYVLERELLPAYSFGWQDSDRLHFHLDSTHVTGASQHQKLVIVDGNTAYIGGIDITRNRWDTSAHAADEPGRTDPSGKAYGPFHDVQAVVSGPAAAEIRRIAAERWNRATGETLPAADFAAATDCWPDSVEVAATAADAILATTWADPESGEVTREVEALYADMIGSARRSIYIENQYFTSASISRLLASRLEDRDGPEVVIVLPAQTSGWLEQSTMDVLRNRVLNDLKRADRHGRLGILSPVSDELGAASINVHAKVMIVDAAWARIGSANLSRRSMGLDTECDLLIDGRASGAARSLLLRLLGEHLGTDGESLGRDLDDAGLRAVIARHGDGPRRLEPLQFEFDDSTAILEPFARIVDLEKPVEQTWTESVNRLAADLNGGDSGTADDGESGTADDGESGAADDGESGTADDGDGRSSGGLPVTAIGSVLLLLLLAGLIAWVFTALRESGAEVSVTSVIGLLQERAAHPLAPLIAIPAFVAGSLVVAPATWMIALSAVLFHPVVASVVSIAGTLASTAITHRIGAHFAAAFSRRIPDALQRRIERLASASDTWSLAGLRLIPIAPFTVVNIAIGVAGVPLRPFVLGTALGMGPGILLLCFSIDRALAALRGEPVFDPWIAAVIVFAGAGLIALRVLRQRRRDAGS